MKNTKIIRALTLLAVVASCTHKPTDEERAQAFLQQAQNYYEANNLEAAKPQLDSIHAHFPKLVSFRRQADTLAWRIELKEIDRNLVYVDSVLPAKIEEANALTKPFLYEKDEKFQQLGTYTYRLLRTEWNLDRNYLKPYCNEHGELFITAHYCGKPIDYKQIKLTSGDIFAESEVVESADCHTFTDLDITHEIVSFKAEKLGSLPDFWTAHIDDKVKATFVGATRSYSYKLTKDELKAFVDTYQLATNLADIYQLQELQHRSQVRQTILQGKLANN